MDFIKNLVPPLNATMLTSRLPTISASNSATEFTNTLKERGCKLFERISCRFFDRTDPASCGSSHQQRRTIQTNYISTISSLIDNEPQSNGLDSDKNPAAELPRPSSHNDAQSDNYGLYALKCNRNASAGRGVCKSAAKRPPPIPPQPIQRQLLIAASRDVVHEHFTPVNRQALVITTSGEHFGDPTLPQKSSHTPRRPCKGRAPTTPIQHPSPAVQFDQNLTTIARKNISSALLLDTSYLDPLDEQVKKITCNKEDLYRIAACVHTQHFSLDDVSSVLVNQPPSTTHLIELAISVQNKSKNPQNNRRKRLMKQFSTTESINIFGNNNSHIEHAFDDFNDALSFEPIVPVGYCENNTTTSHQPPGLERVSSFESNFAPLPADTSRSTSPTGYTPPKKVNYAARFAAAFAEAFSEEDGIADVVDPTEPTPSSYPDESSTATEPPPALLFPNPVVHALRPAAITSATPASTLLSQQQPHQSSLQTNLITNFQRNPAEQRDDNNTASVHRNIRTAGDAAKTSATQLRSSSHPNQMKSPQQTRWLAERDGDSTAEHKNTTETTTKDSSLSLSTASGTNRQIVLVAGEKNAAAVQPPAIDNQFRHVTRVRDSSISDQSDGFIMAAPTTRTSEAAADTRERRVNNSGDIPKTTAAKAKTTTRRTVYVMDI